MMLDENFTGYDYAAEYQLIGWVLVDNSLYNQVYHIQPEVFHYGFHAEIWEAAKKLNNAGKPITPFTLKPLLKPDVDGLEPVLSYLAKSVSASLLMRDVVTGAEYLQDLHQKRKLATVCSQLNPQESLLTNAGKLTQVLLEIAETTSNDDFEDNLMVSDQIIKDMRTVKTPAPTGIRRLDEAMDGGLYEGKSYGFAARKKVGKTALAATISANLNYSGIKHLFICGEMSPKEIHQRVLARYANIYPTAFRSEFGKTNSCEQKLMQTIKAMPRNTLYKNAPGMTFDDLRQICTLAIEKHSVKGIILDYWQLVGGKKKNQSTSEHLDDVAQWIADFGRTHRVWMIAMAQLNQDDNTRGGEGIRLAFDQLYQLHRDDLTEPYAYMEMMETRYTQWLNVGDKENPRLRMNNYGPFFEEIEI